MTTTLLALAVVVAAAQVGGAVATRLRQPRVIGELLAGLILGPSAVGAVAPGYLELLFPDEVVVRLEFVAELGLVLFVTLVGVEFDRAQLRGQGRRAVVVSLVSIVVPFALGLTVAGWIGRTTGEAVDPAAYAVFLGAAMAVTAFPVLVRILESLGISRAPLGTLVIACAGVDDVVAWVLLAISVAVATSGAPGEVVGTVVLAAGFAVVVLGVLRPALARLPRVPLPLVVLLSLGGAWATDRIGVSVVFGAFLVGLAVPRGETAAHVERMLAPFTTTVLLPAFFVVVGLATRVGSIDSVDLWIVTLLVVVIASVGKFGGAAVAARATGSTWADALAIGSLMNARGLTEVVVLTIGIELAVIGPTTFTIMVLMAVITTVAAGPLARRFLGSDPGPDPSSSAGSVGPSGSDGLIPPTGDR